MTQPCSLLPLYSSHGESPSPRPRPGPHAWCSDSQLACLAVNPRHVITHGVGLGDVLGDIARALGAHQLHVAFVTEAPVHRERPHHLAPSYKVSVGAHKHVGMHKASA